MELYELKKEIGITSQELCDQIQRLIEFEGKIPQIDFDIVLGNIRKLYEDLHGLYKLNKQLKPDGYEYHPRTSFKTLPTDKEDGYGDTRGPENKNINTPEVETGDLNEKNKPHESAEGISEAALRLRKLKEELSASPHLESDELNSQVSEDVTVEPLSKDQKEQDAGQQLNEKSPKTDDNSRQEQEPIARREENKRTNDLFPEHKTTLAEKFMDNQDNTIADKIKRNKVSDIRNAIDINQKFLFVNELFRGDLNSYNQAIERLNSFSSLDDALDYMAELTNKYNWDLDNEAINHLIRFIERRY